MSVRAKLTFSYAGFLLLAGALLLAAVWAFLVRALPDVAISAGGVVPIRRVVLDAFLPSATAVMVFLLVFGLVGGWLLAGRVLAPLARIADATRLAANGWLSHRIELEGRADEFRELADAFDEMLARLEAHVGEQRRFASNASHELRTPMAITQAMLEVARDDPEADREELIERLLAVNARAIALTEALLTLSRADRRAFVDERVDVSLLAEEATETLLPLAERRGVAIETSGQECWTNGSPALLGQLVANLVHNAIAHNLPEEGWVRVTAGLEPDGVRLVVANSGPVIAPEVASTLAEPFVRAAERVHGDQAGVGLGLAIVERIARAHRGSLALEAPPEGGLRVTVRLPADRG